MNSATSIKERSFRLKADATAGAKGQAQDNSLRPMHFFVLASLMMATAAVVMSGPSTPAHLVLISLVVAAAGAAAAGFYRMLTPLTEPEPTRADAPLSERSRQYSSAKILVLRSSKELEVRWAMGRFHRRLRGDGWPLRARAIVLMNRSATGRPLTALIERELSARLATRTVGAVAEPAERLAAAAAPEAPAGPVAAPGVCASCHTANDPDAAFCKRCGTRLEEASGSAE